MCSRPRKGQFLALLAFTILILQCVTASRAQTRPPVRIAAAADLQPVLPELLVSYEHQAGEHVEASFASSATLATQIENGAPFDVFLSADMALPERIVHDGFAAAGSKAQSYARGTLVLWTRNQSGIGPLNMQLLRSPAVRSVAIANPQRAPYGRAAMQALTSLALIPAVQPKLRTAENIAQAAQFANTGNADVGLISLTWRSHLPSKGIMSKFRRTHTSQSCRVLLR